jgi:hypothetical protein
MSQRFFFRSSIGRAFCHSAGLSALALCASAPVSLCAQTHKVDAPEKVTRAIGVYEWTGDLAKPGAARLVPVSLLIDSHLEDAGVYLARPVPFVLGTGDVYSIERAGESEGTLDISYARDIVTRRSATDDNAAKAWYGYGTFHTPQEEAKLTKLKPSAKNPVVVGGLEAPDDETPHFVYRAPSATGASGSAGATGSKSVPDTASDTPSPAPDDDPDRPTLRHRDPVDPGKQKKTKAGGYVSPPNSSLNDDPDRPTMRRGIPEGTALAPQLTGLPPDLHQAVAVSDPANRDTHPFTRAWESSHERAETLAAIEGLAQPRVANYLLLNKLLMPGGPAPAKRTPARHTAATAVHRSKPAAPAPPAVELTNEQISGYTLSYGGLPTFLYTAETPVAIGGPVYITMVVQKLPAGELQVALSSVTDAAHLDRTPWLRPVDVVDPDWSHRASLLFELRAQTSRQFALYRLVSAKAEQTFITGIIE